MKLNYEALRDVLRWAETLQGNEHVRPEEGKPPCLGRPLYETLDHVRLCIVSGWLDGVTALVFGDSP